ncbi:MAG: holo-ACP synthase [Planctomycetes bacterium]|nr:holo-ACP synthase [Planctomycetota bacterium]MCC8116048.1 holo-ACP synthase [Planctomycetota bacterium]MCD7898296.1 holo-ACP synthase [Planctomycetaceae bacterium]
MADIFGIGVDMVDIGRIAHLRERHGERLGGVVFRAEELDYCLAKPNPDESLAARFAAKEAVMKALGTGWTGGVTFLGIEVVRTGEGRPEIRLHGTTAETARRLGAGVIHLSLSHARDTAVAQVVIEKTVDAASAS